MLDKELVEITEKGFDVKLQIAYATDKNFTGKPAYSREVCFLHKDAASCLKKAVQIARIQGLKLIIFDGYRPIEVQRHFYNLYPDPEFLSNPLSGAVPHCRGVAIDLSLLDSDGKQLDMGTAFDAFDIKSHHGNIDISKEAQRNRLLLMGIMLTAGFDFYRNEWWHYQLFEPRKYKILSDKEAGTNLISEL